MVWLASLSLEVTWSRSIAHLGSHMADPEFEQEWQTAERQTPEGCGVGSHYNALTVVVALLVIASTVALWLWKRVSGYVKLRKETKNRAERIAFLATLPHEVAAAQRRNTAAAVKVGTQQCAHELVLRRRERSTPPAGRRTIRSALAHWSELSSSPRRCGRRIRAWPHRSWSSVSPPRLLHPLNLFLPPRVRLARRPARRQRGLVPGPAPHARSHARSPSGKPDAEKLADGRRGGIPPLRRRRRRPRGRHNGAAARRALSLGRQLLVPC